MPIFGEKRARPAGAASLAGRPRCLRRPLVRLPVLRLPQPDFGRALQALQRVRDALVKVPRAEVIQ